MKQFIKNLCLWLRYPAVVLWVKDGREPRPGHVRFQLNLERRGIGRGLTLIEWGRFSIGVMTSYCGRWPATGWWRNPAPDGYQARQVRAEMEG